MLNVIILTVRPGRKGRDYDKIWNQERNESPLKTITRSQAEKLGEMLGRSTSYRGRLGDALRQSVDRSRLEALRRQAASASCWCRSIRNMRPRPRRPCATRRSARWQRCAGSRRLRVAAPYYDEPVYIDALANSLESGAGGAAVQARRDPRLVPRHAGGLFDKGDPYYRHCGETTALLRERLKRDDRGLI